MLASLDREDEEPYYAWAWKAANHPSVPGEDTKVNVLRFGSNQFRFPTPLPLPFVVLHVWNVQSASWKKIGEFYNSRESHCTELSCFHHLKKCQSSYGYDYYEVHFHFKVVICGWDPKVWLFHELQISWGAVYWVMNPFCSTYCALERNVWV